MKEKVYYNWRLILCIGLIGIVLFPTFYTIFFTIYSADDFSMILSCNKEMIFSDSIRIANDHYKNWSGIWVYMFIEVLLNPLMHFSLEGYGIGREMVILFSVFVLSLIVLVKTAMKWLLGVNSKEVVAASSVMAY